MQIGNDKRKHAIFVWSVKQNTGYNCLAKNFNHSMKNSEDTSMIKAAAVKAPQQYKPYISLQHLIPPHKIYRRP
jgi:hypothetical protein